MTTSWWLQGLCRLLEARSRSLPPSATVPRSSSRRKHRPDIIADVGMPVMNGLRHAAPQDASGSGAKFIFLTLHAEPRLASDAMRNGASGYVPGRLRATS